MQSFFVLTHVAALVRSATFTHKGGKSSISRQPPSATESKGAKSKKRTVIIKKSPESPFSFFVELQRELTSLEAAMLRQLDGNFF